MTAPENVIAALARVTVEIGGIDKLTPTQRKAKGMAGGGDERGISYPYRGIDQIAAAAQPLFGAYGVVIVPNVTEQRVEQIKVNEKPWTDTFVTVQWTIYGPGGIPDHIAATTTGVGRDNSDKGVNKAMTTAYKNLLLRMLCIGDPHDDTDNADPAERSTEPGEPTSRQVDSRFATASQLVGLRRRIDSLPEIARETLKEEWTKVGLPLWSEILVDDVGRVDKTVAEVEALVKDGIIKELTQPALPTRPDEEEDPD